MKGGGSRPVANEEVSLDSANAEALLVVANVQRIVAVKQIKDSGQRCHILNVVSVDAEPCLTIKIF